MNEKTIENYFKGNYESFYSKYLSQIKKAGQAEYQAKCPFHNDHNPSFNFNSETGKYRCHGCGHGGYVFQFYANLNNLDVKNDFPKILAAIIQEFEIPINGDGKRRLVKTYDYTDIDGKLLFQVCRYEPKTFRIRTPDGHGGYKFGLNGVKPVLYRLHEVVKASDVLIVEGEKDADSLHGLGFTATTNPMGAGKWKQEYSDCLKDKDVILIPDNDNTGREHMAQVGAALKGVARSIRLLELPDLPPKGDFSDWRVTFSNVDAAVERLCLLLESEDEDDQIYRAVEKIKAGEVGIAQLLVDLWRDKLRYDIREGRWYLWGTHFWKRVSDERVIETFEPLADRFREYARQTCQKKIEFIGKDKARAEQLEALEKVFTNALKVLGDVSRRMEILKLCRSEGSYLGFDGAWDNDPYFIPCTNGVLNVDTLDFRPGKPTDNIRTALSIDWSPDAQCPTWKSALSAIFDGNTEIIDWFQRKLGYDTTGLNEHHIIVIWEGKGRNGKGVIYRTLQHVLNGFIIYVDRELLLERKHGRQSGSPAPDVLALQGKRIAILIETAEGRKFDAGKLKVATGGDYLSARGLYAKDITTFKSTAKLHLLTNFRPHISAADYAAWQRIILLPFPISFVLEPSTDPAKMERLADPKIEEKTREEAQGILVWLVAGYRKYKLKGLIPPECIKGATREYHQEEDTIGRFVEEKIENYLANQLPAGDCYKAYRAWCDEQGIHPKHNAVFGREIRLHVDTVKKGNKAFYQNVRIKP